MASIFGLIFVRTLKLFFYRLPSNFFATLTTTRLLQKKLQIFFLLRKMAFQKMAAKAEIGRNQICLFCCFCVFFRQRFVFAKQKKSFRWSLYLSLLKAYFTALQVCLATVIIVCLGGHGTTLDVSLEGKF